MSRPVALRRLRQFPPVAALALISVAFAGCSADTGRFSNNPFASPYASRPAPQDTTGSIPPTARAPASAVENRPLPQYQPGTPPQSYAVYGSQSVSGGGHGVGSYSPPSSPIETTGSVAPKSIAAADGWTREGGSRIIVGTSDTVDILARRYSVPPDAILKANNLVGPRALQPGQQIIIPRRAASASAYNVAPAASAPATRPASTSEFSDAKSVHVVNAGETLMSISRRYKVSPGHLSKANNLTPDSKLKIGGRLTIPGGKAPVASAPAATESKKQVVAAVNTAPAPAAPEHKARVASATGDVDAAEMAAKPSETTAGLPTFRWPVRGRVISGYGAKTNGKQNDGINVAVPEGTPIKAAEDGTVAYAGNELKGYGNLILVRHANGFVSAYAHASELMVKRGDPIKRGQIIGKSGQTGEVSSPQLHFEIRKGSTPVDPQQFLNGV
jgi:murein DD-endopeptidase MepM/ murein hydrolase activator NlpD